MHGIAEPAEDVDVVPAFLVVAAGRVIIDAHLVVEVPVEFGIDLGLQDVLQHAQLGHLFGFERRGIVEHLAVAVAEDVGGEPAAQPEHARLQSRGEDGFYQGLPGFEILAGEGDFLLLRQLLQGGDVHGQIGCTVGERHAPLEGGVSVNHGGGDGFVVRLECFFEAAQVAVDAVGG